MKIRTKVSLLSSIFLVILVAIVVLITILSIKNNTEREIADYRERAIADAELKISEQVNMVHDFVETQYFRMRDKKQIEEKFGTRVKNVVEVTTHLLSDYQARVDSGELSLEEAQAAAKAHIANFRYDDEVGYLWINNTGRPYPTMVMHPTVSSLNDVVLDDQKWNTALGNNTNLFVAAVNLTRKYNAGFIDYQWPKPRKDGTLTEMQPKISYVQLFKPWNWIVGSGVYIDDAQREQLEDIKNVIKSMRYDNGEGYFFVTDDQLPYPKMVMHPITPALDGRTMNNPKWNKLALGGTEDLFTALAKVAVRNKDGGIVDYKWAKPTPNGLTEDLPKISYVKSFKPLNWVIGTGVYIDNIDRQVEQKRADMRKQMNNIILKIALAALITLILSVIASYLFAGKLSGAIEELTDIARDISLGKGLDESIESTARNDEIGQLARAIERLQTSVKIMMKRMRQ